MSPREIVGQAQTLLDEGNVDESLRLIGYVLDNFSSYYEARLARALAFEKAAKVSDAADDAAFVLGVVPSNATALLLSARIQNQRGDQQQARRLWARAAEANPDHQDLKSQIDGLDARLRITHGFLGYSYLRSGWPELAERQFRAAMESDSARMDVRLALAESLWTMGRLEDCRRHCRTVLDHHPDCLGALLMMAHVLTEIGRTNHGAELLDRASELDPEHEVAREMYGRLEFNRMRPNPPASIAAPPASRQSESPGALADNQGDDVLQASDSVPDELTGISADAEEADKVPASGESPTLELDIQAESPTDAPNSGSPEDGALADAVDSLDEDEPQPATSGEDSEARAGMADLPERNSAPLSQAQMAVKSARQGDWEAAMRIVATHMAEGDLQEWEQAIKTICDTDGTPPSAWEALGDLYMRQSRPQTASMAYGRAIEARNVSIDGE